MRIALLSLLALGLMLSPTWAAQKKDQAKELIVGKWKPDGKGKEKWTLAFTEDGQFIISGETDGKKVELKGTYKFTGDDKIETDVDKKKETITVIVTKDDLTTLDSRKNSDTFKRVK
jgi:uncharacterized protein (TIGR03066 family)